MLVLPLVLPGRTFAQAEFSTKEERLKVISDATRTIRLNPRNAEAYNRRGLAYHEDDQDDAAIADYRKAIELNPRYAEAYSNRAAVYTDQREVGDKRRYDQAIADCSKAIELGLKDAATYHRRGIAYERKGQYDQAIADCSKAIELDPDDPVIYYHRADAYRENRQFDQAIADYNKAYKLSPEFAFFYDDLGVKRGLAYEGKGNYEQAIADYTDAIKSNSSVTEAYNYRGLVYFHKGDYDKAIADFDEALKIEPTYAAGRRAKADAQKNRELALKAKAEGKPTTEASVRPTSPADGGSTSGIETTAKENIVDQIRAAVQQGQATGQKKHTTEESLATTASFVEHYNAGLDYRRKRMWNEAISEFSKAISEYEAKMTWNKQPWLMRDLAEAYNSRGLAHYQKSEIDQAVADYNKAIEIDPSFQEAYANRGSAYERTGEHEKASADFAKAKHVRSKH